MDKNEISMIWEQSGNTFWRKEKDKNFQNSLLQYGLHSPAHSQLILESVHSSSFSLKIERWTVYCYQSQFSTMKHQLDFLKIKLATGAVENWLLVEFSCWSVGKRKQIPPPQSWNFLVFCVNIELQRTWLKIFFLKLEKNTHNARVRQFYTSVILSIYFLYQFCSLIYVDVDMEVDVVVDVERDVDDLEELQWIKLEEGFRAQKGLFISVMH